MQTIKIAQKLANWIQLFYFTKIHVSKKNNNNNKKFETYNCIKKLYLQI